jgi:cell division protein ZapA
MMIHCPNCQQKARITSRNTLNIEKTIADLYCSCTNISECGATFVMTLAVKDYLNPPVKSTAQLAQNLLNAITKAERAALLVGATPDQSAQIELMS